MFMRVLVQATVRESGRDRVMGNVSGSGDDWGTEGNGETCPYKQITLPNPDPNPNPNPNPDPTPNPTPTPNPSPNPDPNTDRNPNRNPNRRQSRRVSQSGAR